MISFDDIDIEMYVGLNERELLNNIANNKFYIQDSLLVHNDNLDKYHISFKTLKTKDKNGAVVDRLENGYKYIFYTITPLHPFRIIIFYIKF